LLARVREIGLEVAYRCLRGESLTTATYRERFPDLDPAWLERDIRRVGNIIPDNGVVAPDTEQRQADDSYPTNPPLESFAPQRTAFPGGLALPGYEILGELGRGGMGVVYLAKNKLMNRLEVLKVMNKEMLDGAGGKERFLREIQSAARLCHPNVVTAYSALELGDLLVFAMEYIEGEDLAQLVKTRGPLPVANACYYTQQAALGLQHAFEKKMVHRDIKPQNLILARAGKKHLVKVLDFGLAKVKREKGEDSGLTGEGRILGTPDYMAPEQIRDATNADTRADIYSLGCTLYHLLTGAPPFTGKGLYEKFQAHHTQEAPALDLARPQVTPELAAVVRKMMAKEPVQRYQTPLEVAHALAPFLQQEAKGAPAEPSHEPSRKRAAQHKVVEKEEQMRPAPSPIRKIPKEGARTTPPATAKPSPVRRGTQIGTGSMSLPSQAHSAMRETLLPAQQPAANRRWLIGAGATAGLVLLGFVGLWAGGVFKPTTASYGTIVVENVPDNAELRIDGHTATLSRNGQVVTLAKVVEGPHQVKVVQDNQEVWSAAVMVKRGGDPIGLRVETSSKPPPVGLSEESGTRRWKPLAKTATLDLGDRVTMDFVRIPRGTFRMGSPQHEKQGSEDEQQHDVEMTRDFYLGKHAVTVGQFRAFVRATGYKTEAETGDGEYGWDQVNRAWKKSKEYHWRNPGFTQTDAHPVVAVSWNDAVKFCAWVAKHAGREIRLPTEAEWEYACRAGTQTQFFFGDDDKEIVRFANVADASWQRATGNNFEIKGEDGYPFTAPVGTFQPNAWGLYDMHGNVWQWCRDWYDKDYYTKSPRRDPQGSNNGEDHVLRGGSCNNVAWSCRAAFRGRPAPSSSNYPVGFRVACRMD
jgi:formylglycine-generating enzyme required for sulfatase activity/serine/threonine protein kinase